MRQEHIAYLETDLDYRHAAALAATRAEMDKEVIETVLVAWHDRKAGRPTAICTTPMETNTSAGLTYSAIRASQRRKPASRWTRGRAS